MYKVKITVSPSDKERLQRQLPGREGIWKDYQFFINEPIEEADFWVKLQDCLEKMLKCVDEAGFDVYRPMFIKDEESGEVFFEEYPYKEYDIS